MAKPEDTPMKKQWLEVDGRMTPVILPQIWNHDKEEWEVTSEQSPLPTRVTGSNVEQDVRLKSSDLDKENAIYTSTVEEYKLETLWDGRVLQPNQTGTVRLNVSNEKGVYLFISVDKPKWTLRGRTLFGRLNHETTFPVYINHEKAYSSSEPALAFLLGIRPTAQGLKNPENLDEARSLRMPIGSDEYIMLVNNNDESSTFTVRVLRVW